MGDYERLVCSSDAHDDGAGCSKAEKLLAARVWEDVHRTMSPRHTARPRQLSASLSGSGGFGCPVHFTEGSRHAVFRYTDDGPTEATWSYCPRFQVGVLVKIVHATAGCWYHSIKTGHESVSSQYVAAVSVPTQA